MTLNTFQKLQEFAKLHPTKATKTAGLAVLAEDTGRVLMLQRQHSNKNDGAAGKWEFPGGHVEQDEAHHEAAIREWEEETGIQFPPNGEWNDLHWLSPDKKYMGFIYRIPHEADIEINPDNADRTQNPDDPKQKNIETVAWFSPEDLKDNPAIRDECHATPWHILAPTKKKPTNSFTLLHSFYNENHDEKGRFAPDEGAQGTIEEKENSTGVNYSALSPQKFSKGLRDTTLQALDNPSLAGVIHEWQHGSDNLVRHDPTLIDAIHNAPNTPSILYRGIVDKSGGVKAILNKYKDNSEIDLPASSFSSSYGVGKVFTLGGETEPSKGTSVVFGVLSGSKALPIQNLAETSSYHSEKEFITGGKFRVIGADRNPDIPGGVLVTLKQIDTETLK